MKYPKYKKFKYYKMLVYQGLKAIRSGFIL